MNQIITPSPEIFIPFIAVFLLLLYLCAIATDIKNYIKSYQNKPISKEYPPELEQKLIENDNKINRQSLITFLHLELRAISLAKESNLLRGDDKAMRNCDFEMKSIKRVLEHLDILK